MIYGRLGHTYLHLTLSVKVLDQNMGLPCLMPGHFSSSVCVFIAGMLARNHPKNYVFSACRGSFCSLSKIFGFAGRSVKH